MWKSFSTSRSKPLNSSTNTGNGEGNDFWSKAQESFSSLKDSDKIDMIIDEAKTYVADSIGNIEIRTDTKNSNDSVSTSFHGVAKMLGSIIVQSLSSQDDKKEKALLEKEENQVEKFACSATISDANDSNPQTFESLGNKLLQLMKNSMDNKKNQTDDNKQERLEVSDIVAQVRSRMGEYYSCNENEKNGTNNMGDPNSIREILGMFNQYKDLMKQVASKYVGDIDFKKLTPTAILYYLEREDEIKNPSWKRRQHRFCQGIDMNEVLRLNDACDIAFLSYADTEEEIRDGLRSNKRATYELVYAELRSSAGQPASFVAVKHDQNGLASSTTTKTKKYKQKMSTLEVIIVVRGTKTAADAFTDLLCDSEPYSGGKAHSFIVTSGIYIATKHRKLLLDLLTESGASTIDLTLLGHSLGAGAASIAGMEFNNPKSPLYSPKIKARVIGFGCPALVSEDLAKKSCEYITTVINDSDIVPRMSGISVANLLHDVLEFDWREYAKKDLQCTLQELERMQPLLFRAGTGKAIESTVSSLLEKYGKDFIETKHVPRIPVELFPPGKCLHFYNDGRGISANFVPNTFFNEIDVTRRMIDDHLFFTGYQGVFLAIVRQHTRNHHFRFDGEHDEMKQSSP